MLTEGRTLALHSGPAGDVRPLATRNPATACCWHGTYQGRFKRHLAAKKFK